MQLSGKYVEHPGGFNFVDGVIEQAEFNELYSNYNNRKEVMIISFTGHRPNLLGGYSIPNPQYNLITTNLRNALLELKPEKAISGMALGVDTWAAEICIELNIPLICALPFQNQEKIWPDSSKKQYHKILSQAEKVHYVCDGSFAAYKMQIRNEYLVDNCDLLLAVWNNIKTGGTWNCIAYAQKVGREIKFIKIG